MLAARVLGVLAVGAVACTDIRPDVIYELRRAGGEPLPYELQLDADGCRHMLTSGRITFLGNRDYRSFVTIDMFCPDQQTRRVPTAIVNGRVRLENDTAIFTDTLGNRNGYGLLDLDSLVLPGPQHRLTYVRQRSR